MLDRNMDHNKNHHKIMMSQLDKIYAGETLICPNCNNLSANPRFAFFPDDIGYFYVECDNCNICIQVGSRIIKTDKIKAPIEYINLDTDE